MWNLKNENNKLWNFKLDDRGADDSNIDYSNEEEMVIYKYYTNTKTNLKRASDTGLLNLK